jgi:hypothetical protein
MKKGNGALGQCKPWVKLCKALRRNVPALDKEGILEGWAEISLAKENSWGGNAKFYD